MSNSEDLVKKVTGVLTGLATMAVLAQAATDLAKLGRKDLAKKVMAIGDEEFMGDENGRKDTPAE